MKIPLNNAVEIVKNYIIDFGVLDNFATKIDKTKKAYKLPFRKNIYTFNNVDYDIGLFIKYLKNKNIDIKKEIEKLFNRRLSDLNEDEQKVEKKVECKQIKENKPMNKDSIRFENDEIRKQIKNFKIVDFVLEEKLNDDEILMLKVTKDNCDQIIIENNLTERLKNIIKNIDVFELFEQLELEKTNNGYNVKFKTPATLENFTSRCALIVWYMSKNKLVDFPDKINKVFMFKGHEIRLQNLCSYVNKYSKIFKKIVCEIQIDQ